MAAQPHPAFRALTDYESLKDRSNQHYDQTDAGIREEPDYGSYNNTMSLMNNQVSKISPWAPYFQSLSEQGVNKVGMDAGRPHGIASTPDFWGSGDAGAHAQLPDGYDNPLMQSTNMAGPHPVTARSLALNGLLKGY